MKASVMLLLVAGCAGWNTPGNAQQQKKPVGVIVEFQPSVEFRPSAQAKGILLTRSNLFQTLYLGNSIRCSEKGRLKVALVSGEEREYHDTKWTEVPDAEPPVNRNEHAPLWRLALAEYTKIGGRQRATGGLHCPADRSVIRVGSFDAIRWTPAQFSGQIKLLLHDKASRNVLWRQRNLEGASGQFMSRDFLNALQRHRDSHKGELELELTDSLENRAEVTFSLLANQQEEELQQELELWDKHFTGAMRHIGRAASLRKRKLLNEAATEYDRAIELEEARESIELLRQTILAHELTGNFLRVKDLQARLPQSTETRRHP